MARERRTAPPPAGTVDLDALERFSILGLGGVEDRVGERIEDALGGRRRQSAV